MINKELNYLVRKIEKKFKKYFVGYGARIRSGKYFINIIFDDRDVINMPKGDLRKKLQDIINDLNKTPNKIKARPIFVSDIGYKNIKEILGDFSQITNVRAMTSFIEVVFPKEALEAFKRLPKTFKLEEFKRELRKISKKEYHRNTYQMWLRNLKKAGFIKLKGKIYCKSPGPYKEKLLEKITYKYT